MLISVLFNLRLANTFLIGTKKTRGQDTPPRSNTSSYYTPLDLALRINAVIAKNKRSNDFYQTCAHKVELWDAGLLANTCRDLHVHHTTQCVIPLERHEWMRENKAFPKRWCMTVMRFLPFQDGGTYHDVVCIIYSCLTAMQASMFNSVKAITKVKRQKIDQTPSVHVQHFTFQCAGKLIPKAYLTFQVCAMGKIMKPTFIHTPCLSW